MSDMSEIDIMFQEANERESKLADQCMIQHDMIKAQAALIDELRETIEGLEEACRHYR